MDICLYISDQHSYQVQGYAGNKIIRTPNLDRIVGEGTAFMNAYCAYPVCVPSRMAMLTGQYASKISVMSNHGSLNSNIPTFLHALDINGYNTTLCGRMHFVGPDQRHGFKDRIAGDITQIYNNRPDRIALERGVHNKTPQGGPSSISLVGGGNSPVLEYDRYVIDKALQFLSEDNQGDQFLCVGTYAPHHPFVAPEELFNYYYEKVDVPSDSFSYPEHPALRNNFRDEDPEIVRAVRAAYYGMVEFEDQLIGKVYDAFNDYLKRNNREGIFIYVSDHGEHAGYRGQYGKNTFYEASSHVPMIFAGTGINKGQKKYGPVSLLDIAPTLIGLTNSPQLPFYDGKDLSYILRSAQDDTERIVCCETGGNIQMNEFTYGQMAIGLQKKLIHYYGYDDNDILYDLVKDPDESQNIINENKETADKLRKEIKERLNVPIAKMISEANKEKAYMKVLGKCDFDSEELWHCPENARTLPVPCFRSKKSIETWIKEIEERKQKEGRL